MCHDHPPAAVPLASQLVKRIAAHRVSPVGHRDGVNRRLPVGESVLFDELDESLPEVARHLGCELAKRAPGGKLR